MKKIISVLLILGLLVVGVSALAYGGFGGRRMQRPGFQRPMHNQFYNNPLELTIEQKDQLVAEQKAYFTDTKDLVESIREINQKLRLEIFKGNKEKVDNLQSEINELRDQLNELRIAHIEKMKNILTEKQLGKIKNFWANNQQRFRFGPGVRRGRGAFGPGAGFNCPGGVKRFRGAGSGMMGGPGY